MENKECVLIKRVDLDKLKAEAESKKPDKIEVKYVFRYQSWSVQGYSFIETNGDFYLDQKISQQIKRICDIAMNKAIDENRNLKYKILTFVNLPWYKKMNYKFKV